MFERFTDRARRAIVRAEEEARQLHHGAIGPEHLLLALAEGDGIAARALLQLNVGMDSLRSGVASAVATAKATPQKVPFSSAGKKTLERVLREALALGHNYIGTEHVLLGVLSEPEGRGTKLLTSLGVDPVSLRASIVELTTQAGACSQRSPALAAAWRRATEEANGAPLTTARLLTAMLADRRSQVSMALVGLGVSGDALRDQLQRVPLGETSDAPPGPRSVEIKLGDVSRSIEDPELASQLVVLSADELAAVLRSALAERAGTGGVRGPAGETADPDETGQEASA